MPETLLPELVFLAVALLLIGVSSAMQSVLIIEEAPSSFVLALRATHRATEDEGERQVALRLAAAHMLELLATAGVVVLAAIVLGELELYLPYSVALVVATALAVLLLDQLPRALVALRPRQARAALDPLIRLQAALLAPVVQPFSMLAEIIVGRAPTETTADTEPADEGEPAEASTGPDGMHTADPERLWLSFARFRETTVREIMRSRLDIDALPADTPLSDALGEIVRGGHSRIPLFDGSIDHVIGILYAKDLLHALSPQDLSSSARDLARPAFFVPESKRAAELLQELRAQKVHMAIVVDEYGGVAGLVTIEDLIEEIIGEIQDEYDQELPMIEPTGDYTYVVDARLTVASLNDVLDLNWDSESFDTVGGLVQDRLGRVPATGDSVWEENVELTVLSVERNRIRKILITRHPAQVSDVPPNQSSAPGNSPS